MKTRLTTVTPPGRTTARGALVMPARTTVFVAFAIALCSITLESRAESGHAELLAEWMSGSFSSVAQSQRDSSYLDIRLEVVPIWTERDDGPWLYVEQAVGRARHRPYRQRVYHLVDTEAGAVESVVYTFDDPLSLAGAWRRPDPLANLSPDDLSEREGCTVALHFGPGRIFAGSTRGFDCRSTLRGATYATSEVFAHRDAIRSWDRGFDANSEQVWGAEAGPYAFDRVAEPGAHLPWDGQRAWGPRAWIQHDAINECSGVIPSARHEGAFWVHNDSGDSPRIFALDQDGALLAECAVDGATHVDWEAITRDDRGRLIIGDCGNNKNARDDLVLYIVNEPETLESTTLPVAERLRFRYPNQTAHPDPTMNFDCEAIFWRSGTIYLLSKHRSNTWTRLYSLDPSRTEDEQVATLLDSLDIGGQVTAASLSPDGSELAVLTYELLTLIQLPDTGDPLLGGESERILIEAKQCEALNHEDDLIRIINEQREIHLLTVDGIRALAAATPSEGRHSTPPRAPSYAMAPPLARIAPGRRTALELRPVPGPDGALPTRGALAVITRTDDGIQLELAWNASAANAEPPETGAPERLGFISCGAPSMSPGPTRSDVAWQLLLTTDGITARPITARSANAPILDATLELDPETGRVSGTLALRSDRPTDLALNLDLWTASGAEWYWGGGWDAYGPINPFLWGELLFTE